jgi:hypothetical protein
MNETLKQALARSNSNNNNNQPKNVKRGEKSTRATKEIENTKKGQESATTIQPDNYHTQPTSQTKNAKVDAVDKDTSNDNKHKK